MTSGPTYLGTIQDVQGTTITVQVDKATISGLVFIDGVGYRVGQVGSFVRVPIGFINLYGIVSQVGAGAVPETLIDMEPYGHRWMRVQLIGEGLRTGTFQRGISQYPTINDEVHLTTNDDLSLIYKVPEDPTYPRIGKIASSPTIPAMIDINRLVTRHSAVLGATGSGKSTTVTGMLAALSHPDKYPSTRILVLDIHGEYHSALADRSTVFRVNTGSISDGKSLHIPYWALTAEDLLSMTPFSGLEDSYYAAVVEKIRSLKLESIEACQRLGVNRDTLTADSPVPFSIHRLWYELHRDVFSTHTVGPSSQQNETTEAFEMENGDVLRGDIMEVVPPTYKSLIPKQIFNSGSTLNIRRQINSMGSLLRDSRFDFLFRPGPYCPCPNLDNLNAQPEQDLDALLASWIGSDKPITILDLSGVPSTIQSRIIGALLKLLYDSLFWGRDLPGGGRDQPLLLVLEEAHAYLGGESRINAVPAVRRAIKEGRKYGLGVLVVSQRPSEIDASVLSQCGTLFALRLANDVDRRHVLGAVSDNLEGMLEMLPTLRTGEAMIVGEAVHLPMRAYIEAPPADRRPEGDDPMVIDPLGETGWNSPFRDRSYQDIVRHWRGEGTLQEERVEE